MRATFAYTTARILLFAAATGLFYLAGARGLLLLGLALLVSGAASYVLLSRQRDAMSGALVNRFRTLRARIDEGALRGLVGAAPAELRSSMQKDVQRGNPPELDAIGGPVLRGGERHGIPVPATRELVEKVRQRMQVARVPG